MKAYEGFIKGLFSKDIPDDINILGEKIIKFFDIR